MHRRTTVALGALVALCVATNASAAVPTPDPAAVDVVKRYLTALAKADPQSAYRLLTAAQQHYFRNSRNFASNYATTNYRIVRYSVIRATMRKPDLVQIAVDQTASFFDVATSRS